MLTQIFYDRHGIRQLRTGWADGPSYITQCPIGGGKSYTYKFTVINQRGTLWWHAHYSWQRASVYGAFIIQPRMPYPFSAPIQDDFPIIFGNNLIIVFLLAETVLVFSLIYISPFFDNLLKISGPSC